MRRVHQLPGDLVAKKIPAPRNLVDLLVPNEAPQVYVVEGTCHVTGERFKAFYPADGFEAWQLGALIQSAMPNMPKAQREWLISGTSPKGWRRMCLDSLGTAMERLDYFVGQLPKGGEIACIMDEVHEVFDKVQVMITELTEAIDGETPAGE